MTGTQDLLQRLTVEIRAVEELHSRIGAAVEMASQIKMRMAGTLQGAYDPTVLRTLDGIIQRLQETGPAVNQARKEIEETRLRIVNSAR